MLLKVCVWIVFCYCTNMVVHYGGNTEEGALSLSVAASSSHLKPLCTNSVAWDLLETISSTYTVG